MRITGGTYRSRQIQAPKGNETRPTSSVVREAVCNRLGQRIPGAMVLDLFCGSGILSLEAVSRGAQGAILVDVNREAAAVARRNVQALGLGDVCRVYQSDYLRALSFFKRDGLGFDLGFLIRPTGAVFINERWTFPLTVCSKRTPYVSVSLAPRTVSPIREMAGRLPIFADMAAGPWRL